MSDSIALKLINQDGGGSSALVADSRLLNRPSGRTIKEKLCQQLRVL